MSPFIIYLLKVNGIFSVLFLFYLLLLRRDTFYVAKRFILLGITAVSALLPLVHPARLIPQKETIRYIVLLVNDTVQNTMQPPVHQLTFDQWADIFFLLGMLVSALILLFRYLQLFRAIRKCRATEAGGAIIYVPRHDANPFSFNGRIYLNPELYDDHELKKIIEHERAHIAQHHDVDLMLVTWFRMVAWINPLYYLFVSAVHENIEFLADRKVLSSGNDAREYQYTLLKVAQTNALPFTQNFSFSHLKKRIIMMNKKKTRSVWSGKYLLIFPLLLIMMVMVNASELKSAWDNADLLSGKLPVVAAGDSSKTETHVIVVKMKKDADISTAEIIMDGKAVEGQRFDSVGSGLLQSITFLKDSLADFRFDKNQNREMVIIKHNADHLNIPQPLSFSFKGGDVMSFKMDSASIKFQQQLGKIKKQLGKRVVFINISDTEKEKIIKEWSKATENNLPESFEKLQLSSSTNLKINPKDMEAMLKQMKTDLSKIKISDLAKLKIVHDSISDIKSYVISGDFFYTPSGK